MEKHMDDLLKEVEDYFATEEPEFHLPKATSCEDWVKRFDGTPIILVPGENDNECCACIEDNIKLATTSIIYQKHSIERKIYFEERFCDECLELINADPDYQKGKTIISVKAYIPESDEEN
jgi:hypothetical protein